MKCKKYDQSWFDNRYIQLLKMQCTPSKKIRKLQNFMLLAKKHGINPKATKESKEKFVREDFGVPKSRRALQSRKKKLKRKRFQ